MRGGIQKLEKVIMLSSNKIGYALFYIPVVQWSKRLLRAKKTEAKGILNVLNEYRTSQ